MRLHEENTNELVISEGQKRIFVKNKYVFAGRLQSEARQIVDLYSQHEHIESIVLNLVDDEQSTPSVRVTLHDKIIWFLFTETEDRNLIEIRELCDDVSEDESSPNDVL